MKLRSLILLLLLAFMATGGTFVCVSSTHDHDHDHVHTHASSALK